jgi:hypothetical protein
MQVNYKQICHDNCSLDGITTELINNVDLKKCSVMHKGYCTVCKCLWDSHMHIRYKITPVKKKVIDENIRDDKLDKLSKIDKLKAVNGIYDRRIEKLIKEQEFITKISAKFAYFTKTNAIVPFNDIIESYLDILIQEENNKKNNGVSNSLEGLTSIREQYKEEKKTLEYAVNNRSISKITSNDITILEKELYDMELNGPQFKMIISDIRKSDVRLDKPDIFHENRHIIKIQKRMQDGKEMRNWIRKLLEQRP